MYEKYPCREAHRGPATEGVTTGRQLGDIWWEGGPLLGSLPKNPGPQSKPDSSLHDTQFIKLVILPCDLQAFFFPKLLGKKLIIWKKS